MIASDTASTTSRSGPRILLIVLGSIAGLFAIALLVGGGVIVWVHEAKRDASGYYATSAKPLATPTFALVSSGLEIGTGVPDAFLRRGRLGTIRVVASGASRHAIFIGVARTARVRSDLHAVVRDELTDFEVGSRVPQRLPVAF
jgi:hypothetical protein